MRTLVVYFTKFGNTQQVAETIAQTIQAQAKVRCIEAAQMAPEDLERSDLIIIGAPTHRMDLPQDLKPLLKKLPKRSLRGKQVAAFDTSYRMSPFLARFTASKKLARKLRRMGGKLTQKPESFHVEVSQGPLFDGELERARDWASRILAASNRVLEPS